MFHSDPVSQASSGNGNSGRVPPFGETEVPVILFQNALIRSAYHSFALWRSFSTTT